MKLLKWYAFLYAFMSSIHTPDWRIPYTFIGALILWFVFREKETPEQKVKKYRKTFKQAVEYARKQNI